MTEELKPGAAYFLVSFESTHAAMASEKVLSRFGATMLPVPKAISAGCGMALHFKAEGPEEAKEMASLAKEARGLATLYMEIEGVYAEIASL